MLLLLPGLSRSNTIQEENIEGLEIKEKGQFSSVLFGHSSYKGGTCNIALYANGYMVTFSRSKSGFGCPYIQGKRHWVASREKILQLVSLLSQPGILKEKTAETYRKLSRGREYRIIKTTQGDFTVTRKGEIRIRNYLDKLYRTLSQIKPKNKDSRTVQLPEIHYNSAGSSNSTILSIEPSGTAVLNTAQMSNRKTGIKMLSIDEISLLEELITPTPPQGLTAPVKNELSGKMNPGEEYRINMKVDKNTYKYKSSSIPGNLQKLNDFFQTLIKQIQSP